MYSKTNVVTSTGMTDLIQSRLLHGLLCEFLVECLQNYMVDNLIATVTVFLWSSLIAVDLHVFLCNNANDFFAILCALETWS